VVGFIQANLNNL